MNNYYAGIGSRRTPKSILDVMKEISKNLAKDGWILNAGAAPGAGQAFVEGALAVGGKVNLFLPWSTYEKKWVSKLRGNIDITIFNPERDIAAVKSVYNFYPAAKNFKRHVFALHACNYLILCNARFVVLYTSKGRIIGGTGQAIKLAKEYNKNIFNLGNKKDLQEIINGLNGF